LRDMRRSLVQSERGNEQSERVKLLDQGIAGIEAGTASPTLLDLKEFKARPASVR